VGPTVRLLTYGCQMNEADSLSVERQLAERGFTLVDDVEAAEAVVLNTCSVRRKAEERVFGQLGHLKALKEKRRGNLVIGVVGCMARAARDELLERAPYVDFVLTPDELDRVVVELASRLPPPGVVVGDGGTLPADPFPFKRYLPVMRGCDNFCTYCVVPYVRGRERSMPAPDVEAAVSSFAAAEVREVTLLGQNVNSYRWHDVDFPRLLDGLARRQPRLCFRFLTSHPKDLSDDLVAVMADRPNVLPALHLPLQAGANRILSLMNRRYTLEHYLDRVTALRRAVPDIALTTDLICGFPGETEDDFVVTLDAVRTVRYDSAFMFYYQERPHTRALDLPDQVPVAVRKERLKRLIDIQQAIGREVNQRHVGQLLSVLVEQPSRRDTGVLAGRTGHDKTILFAGSTDLVGHRVTVRCTAADAYTLRGERVAEP